MPTRDLHNHIHIVRGLSPQKQTNADTAFVSEIVDTAGYESVEWVTLTGALTDAGVTFVVLMEDGDQSNLSDNAAVADTFLLGTETTATFTEADDNEVRKLGYIGSKRYVRVTITPTGNSSGDINIAGCWILGHARHQPTASLAND
jgi:hypothetical protein